MVGWKYFPIILTERHT